MFKFFRSRKPTEIDRNHARIQALHSELKKMLQDPSLDPKAPHKKTPEYQALEDEFVALVKRNMELMSPSSKKQ